MRTAQLARWAAFRAVDKAPASLAPWPAVGCLGVVVCLAGAVALAAVPGRAGAADDPLEQVVELTNAERHREGLGPLVRHPSIARAAQAYADVLAGGDCFAHTCGPVADFTRRASDAGYTGWTGLAENIAGGNLTPEAVVAAWMTSPGHRANILNPAFTEVGVGRATGGRYGVYWTQVFGARPAPALPPAVDLEPPNEPQTLAPEAVDTAAPETVDMAAPEP